MTLQNPLFLYEECMLLALRDEEGTVASGVTYQYAIGAAVLAELLLHERIAIDKSKKKIVKCICSNPVGNPLIDDCLTKIAQAKKPASLQTWVSRFARIKKLKQRVAEQLCRRGILRADEGKVLLIFSRKIYPEVDPAPERKLIERLRRAIFTSTRQLDPRTVVLVSLANSTGLLKVVFDKAKLKERKARLERIANGEMTGQAAKEAVEAMQAAVMVACILPVVLTTTTVHH